MKKTKLIARIIAGLLVLIMVLGLIVPYVSATEVDGDTNTDNDSNVVVDDDIVYDSSDEEEMVYDLPSGFHYEESNGKWVAKKDEDNDMAAFQLLRPEGFNTQLVTLFVCNIETLDVVAHNFDNTYNYLDAIDLPDGYYVVYANNYAWSDQQGNTYAINGGKYQYFYIGDSFDTEKYNAHFEVNPEILKISMSEAPSNYKVVQFGAELSLGESDLTYPQDAILEPIHKIDPDETIPDDKDQQKPTKPSDPSNPDNPERKTLGQLLVDFVKSFFADTWFLLLLAAGCFGGLKYIEFKKQKGLEKQAEFDDVDDGCIE